MALNLSTLGDSQSSIKQTTYITRPARVTPAELYNELVSRGADINRPRVHALSGDTLGRVSATLNADITSGASSMAATSSSDLANWAASGYLRIDNEVMGYTYGGSGASITLTSRGQQGGQGSGGPAAAHTAGAKIYHLPTPSALVRIAEVFQFETPDFLDLFMGTNDKNYASTQGQSTIQANAQAVLKAAKYSAAGLGLGQPVLYATPSALPANAPPNTRCVVAADDSSTGGPLAKGQTTSGSRAGMTDPAEHPTITGDPSGTPQTVWERRNPLAGEAGWARVAIASTTAWGVQMTAFCSVVPRNWASADNGDVVGTPYAADAPAYDAVVAAVAAEAALNLAGDPAVAFVDFRGYGAARIAAGLDRNMAVAGYDQTKSWHVASGNQHLNDYGHWLRAQCILDSTYGIPASWKTALGL